ncbi:hypothetical protein K1719_009375 [Acacia pycnantha]|nr:hypothetical protein K1719_009375 [Acacia pycnantha]
MKGHNINNVTKIDCFVGRHKLSTEEIIRVVGERYVQFSTYWDDNICMPMHPYESSLGGLSKEENRDVELVQFLLVVAESRLRTLRTSKTRYFYTVNRTHQLTLVEIKERHFEINDDEVVAVYATYEARVLGKLDEHANEKETTHDDSLFFFSAYGDCDETCVKDVRECRMALDAMFCVRIRNVVANEEPQVWCHNHLTDEEKVQLILYHVTPKYYSLSDLLTVSNLVSTQAFDSDESWGLNFAEQGNQVNVSTGVVETVNNALRQIVTVLNLWLFSWQQYKEDGE